MENNTKQLNNEVNEIAVVDEHVNTNDIVTVDKVSPSIFEADGAKDVFFSSIQSKDRKSAIKVYNAINSSENPLADHRGEVLQITDMVAHAITLEDEVTKENVDALRVVLVAKDGKAYHAISQGVVSSIQKIISIVGPAPWNEPLEIVPVEVKTRKGFKTLTLQLQG
ncbi:MULTISPECIES: hypothetical protein [Bacillus cereus group]|uniref:hypothetical protein n=1 Tax=Bacillus cereus group TaxID=86661 RepID=UPI0009BEC976|nr:MULTISPECIES: hypothetical protein [Bacillus cereus group]MCC3939556.1 hypothetical protein [Bacillus thuringiensis]MCC3976587.1 hypothetical protein [Bacillus thuringiensis]MCC3995353.1 hypothetical protein [Bacillus thuringiensis]MCC4007633.1 hypothetical protein [Bacillus thuringiensis serovar kurstaki]MCU5220402.1 hypothetical protein [Bacillus cereus]